MVFESNWHVEAVWFVDFNMRLETNARQNWYVSNCQFVERDSVNIPALTLRIIQWIDVFSRFAEKVFSQQLDPTNHLAVNSRLLVRQHKKHGFQMRCGKYMEQTVDDAQQMVGAGDLEF